MSVDPNHENDVIRDELMDTWIDREGILHKVIKPGAKLTIDDAKRSTATDRELSGGRKRRQLIDIRQVVAVSIDARAYLTGPEAQANILALAGLVRSPLSRIVGTFFMGLNKPPFPAKLFNSEAKALEWLREFSDPTDS